MIKLLEDEAEILAAQRKFSEALLKTSFNQTIFGIVNCLGGKFQEDLHYSEEFNLWYLYKNLDGKKHWNALGEGRPNDSKGLRINSEINIPAQGINRAMAGAFGRDDGNGKIYLLHRGKIRGGKELFFKHVTGTVLNAMDGNKSDNFALIAELDSPQISQQLADFVAQVIRIKEQK